MATMAQSLHHDAVPAAAELLEESAARVDVAVHDASRLGWQVTVPLPERQRAAYSFAIEVEVPTNLVGMMHPWAALQSYARLDGTDDTGAAQERSVESFRRVVVAISAKLARAYKVSVHTHLCETWDEERYTLEKYRQRPIGWIESLGWMGDDVWFAHAIHVDDDEIRKFAKAGCGAAHCPCSNMRLGSGIAYDQLWFTRSGQYLVMSVIGRDQSLTVAGWYNGTNNHLAELQTADGHEISDTGMQQLVQAMSAYTPPAEGQTTLPPDLAQALAPALAANWQHA